MSTEQSIYWAGSHIVKIFLLLHLPNRNLIFQCLFPFNTSFYKLFDNSISEKISFFLLIFTIALIFQFIKKINYKWNNKFGKSVPRLGNLPGNSVRQNSRKYFKCGGEFKHCYFNLIKYFCPWILIHNVDNTNLTVALSKERYLAKQSWGFLYSVERQ